MNTESNLQPAFDREAALQWWNNLSNGLKHSLSVKYLSTNQGGIRSGNALLPENLTGREIQQIWEKEKINDESDRKIIESVFSK